jgi:YkoP-like protein
MAHLGELSGRLGRRIVFTLDDHLRRFEGIYAYSKDPHCVIRISHGVSRKKRVLADGTLIRVGDPLIELHWWNEHIAHLAGTGPSLNWGLQFYRHTYHSLIALAQYVQGSRELGEMAALHGETTFPNELSYRHHANAFRRLGFELVTLPPPANPTGLALHSLRQFHVWALTWASNPASLRRKAPCSIVRCELWISRQSLLDRCAAPEAPALLPNGHNEPLRDRVSPRERLPVDGRTPPQLTPANGTTGGGAADAWTLLRARMRGHYSSWKR